jgi:hypothetical protein
MVSVQLRNSRIHIHGIEAGRVQISRLVAMAVIATIYHSCGRRSAIREQAANAKCTGQIAYVRFLQPEA